MGSDSAWLIERVGSPPAWLGNTGASSLSVCWGPANDAIRFSRQEDAEAAALALLPEIKKWVVTEHEWPSMSDELSPEPQRASASPLVLADILTAAVELLDKVSKHDDGVTRFAYQMRDLLGRVVERLASASSEEAVRAMCEVCGERPAKHVATEAANMLMCAECLAAVAEALAAEKAREPDDALAVALKDRNAAVTVGVEMIAERDAEIERLRVECETLLRQQKDRDERLVNMMHYAECQRELAEKAEAALADRDALIERMRKDLEREARDRIDLATALGGKMQPTKAPENEELEQDLNAMRAFLREHRKANEDRAAGIGVYSRAFAAMCRQVLDLLQENTAR